MKASDTGSLRDGCVFVFAIIVLIIILFVFISIPNCEKIYDKIDGQRWDREKQEWVENE